MKKIICILTFAFLCTGCSSDMAAAKENSTSAVVETAETTGFTDTVADVSAMEAPDRTQSDQSYYKPLETHTTDKYYEMSGTIHLDQWRGLIKIDAPEDTVLSIKGAMTRVEGEIQLLCQEPDGNILTLAESSADTKQSLPVDIKLNVKSGISYIYFFGPSAVYDFDLNLELSDDFKYYLD